MIKLQINIANESEINELGVYYLIYSTTNSLQLTNFQKAYIYSVLKGVRRDGYGCTLKYANIALSHLCNYLNSSMDGDLVFEADRAKLQASYYNLTSECKIAYERLKSIYDSIDYHDVSPSPFRIKYKVEDESVCEIHNFETEIIAKYNDQLGRNFKSRAIINDKNKSQFRMICRKISDFYYIMYKTGEIPLCSSLVYIDFIPKCFPQLPFYTPINLALGGNNYELLNYSLRSGVYNFATLIESYPINDNECVSFVVVHSFCEISSFIVCSERESLTYYKKFRARHFSLYEDMMKLRANMQTEPGFLLPKGNAILNSDTEFFLINEYKASVLTNDMDNLKYLIYRYRDQLVEKLRYCQNRYIASYEEEETPSCVHSSTINLLDYLLKLVKEKIRDDCEIAKNRPWGYNAVTGAPISHAQLKDIDSQRW